MTEQAPFFDDVSDGPANGKAVWLKTTDGLRIRVGYWTVEGAKGTILLFPGRTEYIEKYGRDATKFTQQGFNVVAVDWRGQGIADRMNENRALGHVHRFTDYQHDVQATLGFVRQIGLAEPLFLLAHSMGGCIGLRSLHEGLDVRAAAFSAPMWGISLPTAMRPLAWGISGLSKPLGFSNTLAFGQVEETYVLQSEFDGNTLTTDPEMFNYMRRQVTAHPELSLGGPTLHWLNEALVEMRNLRRKAPPAVPTITFLGSEEAIVVPNNVRDVMSRWPNGKLIEFDNVQHEVLMERAEIRNSAIASIVEHFEKHLQFETA